MLRTLLESNAPRQRRRGSTAASVAVHTLIIGGAIVATASAKPGTEPPILPPADTVIYVATDGRPPEPKKGGGPLVDRRRDARDLPPIDRRVVDLVLPGVDRPPVDVDIERLLGDDIPAGTILGPRGSAGGERGGPSGGEPATVATVDRPAAMVAPPRPRYPDPLRAAGVTGRVVVRLVVDTSGRVEPGSIVIRESSHDLFAQSVRAVLPSLRFTPAEAGGRKVRMLVDLPFEFRLNE